MESEQVWSNNRMVMGRFSPLPIEAFKPRSIFSTNQPSITATFNECSIYLFFFGLIGFW